MSSMPRKVRDMTDDQLAITIQRSADRLLGGVRKINSVMRELYLRGHLTAKQLQMYRLCLGRPSEGERALREINVQLAVHLAGRLLRPEYVPQQPPAWSSATKEALYRVAPDLRRKP